MDRQIARKSLSHDTSTNFQPIEVQTLSEALEQLRRRNDISVVLLDLGLPDAAGIGSIESIHKLRPNIPIIVLTGWDNVFSEKIKEAGASDYIVKSEITDRSQLCVAVKKVLPPQKVTESETVESVVPEQVSEGGETPRNLEISELVTEFRLACGDAMLQAPELAQSKEFRRMALLAKRIQDAVTALPNGVSNDGAS